MQMRNAEWNGRGWPVSGSAGVKPVHGWLHTLLEPGQAAIDRPRQGLVDLLSLLGSESTQDVILAGEARRRGVDADPQAGVLFRPQGPLDVAQAVVPAV